MTTTTTERLLGVLALEVSAPAYDPQHDSSGPVTWYRPTDTYLLNDVTWRHWMRPAESDGYMLVADTVGWVVTCGGWPPGHTYRLARAGELVDALPLADGTTSHLDRGRSYVIRLADPHAHDSWELYEVA